MKNPKYSNNFAKLYDSWKVLVRLKNKVSGGDRDWIDNEIDWLERKMIKEPNTLDFTEEKERERKRLEHFKEIGKGFGERIEKFKKQLDNEKRATGGSE